MSVNLHTVLLSYGGYREPCYVTWLLGALSNPLKEQNKSLGPFIRLSGLRCSTHPPVPLPQRLRLLQGTTHLSVWERRKLVREGDSPRLWGSPANIMKSWHLCWAFPRAFI